MSEGVTPREGAGDFLDHDEMEYYRIEYCRCLLT